MKAASQRHLCVPKCAEELASAEERRFSRTSLVIASQTLTCFPASSSHSHTAITRLLCFARGDYSAREIIKYSIANKLAHRARHDTREREREGAHHGHQCGRMYGKLNLIAVPTHKQLLEKKKKRIIAYRGNNKAREGLSYTQN